MESKPYNWEKALEEWEAKRLAEDNETVTVGEREAFVEGYEWRHDEVNSTDEI